MRFTTVIRATVKATSWRRRGAGDARRTRLLGARRARALALGRGDGLPFSAACGRRGPDLVPVALYPLALGKVWQAPGPDRLGVFVIGLIDNVSGPSSSARTRRCPTTWC